MKKTATIIILVILCIDLKAQAPTYVVPSGSSFDYRLFKNNQLSYFNTLVSDTGEASQKNAFLRTERNSYKSILAHGDITSLYFSNTAPISCGPNAVTDKNWREIGPNKHVTNPSTLSGTGPVSFITFDPDDNNTMLTGSWVAGLFYSQDYGENWKNGGTDKLNPPSAAYAVVSKATATHSNKAWFLASGHGHAHGGTGEGVVPEGIFRSIDKGASWVNIADFHDLQSVDGSNPNVPVWNFQITKIQTDYNNPDVLLATTQNGIFRTANAFDPNPTWVKVYPSVGMPTANRNYLCCDITYQPAINNPNGINSNSIFACVTDNNYSTLTDVSYIIYSTNNGLTWQNLPGLTPKINSAVKLNLELSPANPNLMYILSWDSLNAIGELQINDPNVYKYYFANGNPIISYNLGMVPPQYDAMSSSYPINVRVGWDFGFAISNTNSDSIIAGAVYYPKSFNFQNPAVHLIKGLDGIIHNDIQQLVFSPTNNEIWAATHGGIYKYNPSINTWQPKSKGLGTAMVSKMDNAHDYAGKLAVALDHDGIINVDKPYTKFEWNYPFTHYIGGDGIDVIYNSYDHKIFGRKVYTGSAGSVNYAKNYVNNFIYSIASEITDYANYMAYNETNPSIYYSTGLAGVCRRITSTLISPVTSLSSWQDISNFALPGTFASGETVNQIVKVDMVSNKGILNCLSNVRSNIMLTDKLYDIPATVVSSWWRAPIPTTNYIDYTGATLEDKFWIADFAHINENEYLMCSANIWKLDNITSVPIKNRVMKLTVNNWGAHTYTYTDLTYNLPNLSVNAISYYNNGSEGYIFIGTNRGVFYTTQSILNSATSTTQVWSCYGQGLPNIKNVSNFALNSCAGVLRVGTNGRGVWEIDLPVQTLATNLTINSTVNYTGDLIVPTGKTLTVDPGGVLQMGAANRIVVQKGAKIIVNGGTITSQCNEVWGGIQLQGDFTKRQIIVSGLDAEHGYCIVKSNGTIKNASSGINNYVNANENGDIDWSKQGGGIIQCTDANFINCIAGARFISYINTNALGAPINDRSYFTNCKFITDTTIAPKAFSPISGITMWNTKGINFKYCLFKNVTPYSLVAKRGAGITSWDASFDVSAPCASFSSVSGACATYYAGNTFENLGYGIDAGASLPNVSVKINNNVFTNNYHGVVLHSVDFAQVMENTISLGPISISSSAGTGLSISPSCGIYLDACDAYAVKNNTIHSTLYPGNNLSYGIVNSYSNINPNELKQNKFYNIGVGIQAQENNDGLQLKCNKFNPSSLGAVTIADVKVMGQYTYGSIAAQQGYCDPDPKKLPGNEFSHTCGSAQDLSAFTYDPSAPVQYNTRTSPAIEVPQVGCFNSSYYSLNYCIGTGAGNACAPSTGSGGFSPLSLKLALTNSKNDVRNLTQLLAEGNAEILYNILSTGTEAEINEDFLRRSPYLSDSILLLFLAHTPQLSDLTIQNILVANSPLTSNVMASYSQLTIDPEIAKTIDIAQVGQSQRKYTELGLAYEQSQLVINYNNLISYVLNDNSSDNDNVSKFDTLIKNLDYTISPNSRAVIIGALIEQHQFNLAQAQLDSLHTTPQHRTYLDNLMLLRQAVNQQEAYTGAIKTCIDSLKLSRPANVGVKAQALYNGLFKYSFGEEIYASVGQVNRLAQKINEEKLEQAKEDFVKVYPNPATNELYFLFKTTLVDDVKVNLYDVNGRLVKTKLFTINDEPKLLELNDLQDGIYFYQVLSANTLIKANKVVIIK